MKNVVVTITGPSGSGKSTLESMLKKKGFVSLISVTTRQIRENEENGKNYYFVSQDQFENMLKKDELVEHVEFGGNKYGLLKAEILRVKALGQPAVIVVEPCGKKQIDDYAKSIGVKTMGVFIDVDRKEQMTRLLRRFFEDMEKPQLRMNRERKYGIYAERFVEVMTTEQMWRANAYSHTEFGDKYEVIIPGFDSNTETDVIRVIEAKVDELLIEEVPHFTRKDEFLYT